MVYDNAIASGIGKEHVMVGLYEYTNLKRIQVDLTLRK